MIRPEEPDMAMHSPGIGICKSSSVRTNCDRGSKTLWYAGQDKWLLASPTAEGGGRMRIAEVFLIQGNDDKAPRERFPKSKEGVDAKKTSTPSLDPDNAHLHFLHFASGPSRLSPASPAMAEDPLWTGCRIAWEGF